ncbi:hypothetical protein EB001_22710 [bacterium]|nr:hypothetical protein [bacterium]
MSVSDRTEYKKNKTHGPVVEPVSEGLLKSARTNLYSAVNVVRKASNKSLNTELKNKPSSVVESVKNGLSDEVLAKMEKQKQERQKQFDVMRKRVKDRKI